MNENNRVSNALRQHKIPAIVIVMVAIQVIGIVWWSAKLDSRMSYVEKQVASNSEVSAMVKLNTEWIKENRKMIAEMPRLEERLENISKVLSKIETRLNLIITRLLAVEKSK